MNFFTWVLISPLLMFFAPFSPFALLITTENTFYSCNRLVTGKIIFIENVDSFRCNMKLYLYDRSTNITLKNLHCDDLGKCIRHVNKCINATISINNLYPERCTNLILSGGDQKVLNSYESDYNYFIGSLISFVFLIFIIILCNKWT